MDKIYKAIKGILSGAAFFILYVAITYFVGLCMYCFIGNDGETYYDVLRRASNVITLISSVLTVTVSVFIFKSRQKNIVKFCNITKPKAMLVITAFTTGISFNMFTCAISDMVPAPESWEQSHTEAVSSAVNGNLALVVIVVMLVAPMVEEFLFRGLFFEFVKTNWNEIAAFVVTSVFFCVVHGNPIQAIYSFVGGLIFCYFRTSGSLFYSVVAHIGFNMGNLFTLLLGVESPLVRLIIGTLVLVLSSCGFVLFKNIYIEKNQQKEIN